MKKIFLLATFVFLFSAGLLAQDDPKMQEEMNMTDKSSHKHHSDKKPQADKPNEPSNETKSEKMTETDKPADDSETMSAENSGCAVITK